MRNPPGKRPTGVVVSELVGASMVKVIMVSSERRSAPVCSQNSSLVPQLYEALGRSRRQAAHRRHRARRGAGEVLDSGSLSKQSGHTGEGRQDVLVREFPEAAAIMIRSRLVEQGVPRQAARFVGPL